MTQDKGNKEKENPLIKIASHEAPVYTNSARVASLEGIDFNLWDIVKIAASARLNLGLASSAGMGKSQLFADLQALYGNNANYVLGRNDLDIKSLFRMLDFSALTKAMEKGSAVSQKEMSQVTADIYRPLIVVEEINRCAEVVQNQLFNIFEGFIEIDGKKYALGKGRLETFRDLDGTETTRNVKYSIGVWSANFGNGQYTGTVSMDKALKERSHIIIDVDNFTPGKENPSDLDAILLGSGGEVRLKEQESPEDRTKDFIDAFAFLKQKAYAPTPEEIAEEMLLFRYLVLGLDYIPCKAAKDSKRIMKEVWPAKAEEDNIGDNDNDKIVYRMTAPASIRSAQTIIMFARALREYAKAKKLSASPSVFDSVIESFKLAAPYSGIIENPNRIREDYVGNNYLAACAAAKAIKERLDEKLMKAVAYFKADGKPLPKNILDACNNEFRCFR